MQRYRRLVTEFAGDKVSYRNCAYAYAGVSDNHFSCCVTHEWPEHIIRFLLHSLLVLLLVLLLVSSLVLLLALLLVLPE